MNVTRNNLSASRIELSVLIPAEEMLAFSKQAANRLSERITIEGFRPGKAPFETIKARVGDMALLEEASRLAISKTIDQALKEQVSEDWIGQPEITISKLAPDNDFEYKALITLLPSVTLGDYKSFNIAKDKIEVSDEEVDKVIAQLRDTRVKESSVDRPTESGDKVVLDIAMSLDNVPLEGGQQKDASLVIGKEYVVPGFDDNLIGLGRGAEKDFSVHYPADFHQKNIAGKKVQFHVVVKDIFARELPELNDGFALDFGLKSLEELKKNIRHSIEHEKSHEAAHKQERAILEKVVAATNFGEIPDALVDNEVKTMLAELEYNVNASGGKFADYLLSLGKSSEALSNEFKPQALQRVKTSLMLRALINAEKLVVSDEEIEKELKVLREQYKADTSALETINSSTYRKHIKSLLLNRQAIAKLLEWNNPTI
jgi:trigger factor